jgi:hypothetical protein
VSSKRANKFCTHAHHIDRSVAAAIFANGTYFVDTPDTNLTMQAESSLSEGFLFGTIHQPMSDGCVYNLL